MTGPRGWTLFVQEEPGHALEAMRAADARLHDQVVLFLRSLALEAGAAVEAGKPLPGHDMGDGRYNIAVPHDPVLITYTRFPGLREFRVSDLIWIG